MITISTLETSTDKKNVHHQLSPKFGGHKSNKVNQAKIPMDVHDEYNRITKGGCIPSIRLISQHVIRSLEHSARIINPDAVNELLKELTPMDWRDCYQPRAVAEEVNTRRLDDTTGFDIAQNWLDAVDHEEYLARRAIRGIMHTKRGHSRNTALVNTLQFFETEEPMEVVSTYVSDDNFCNNLQQSLRRKICSIVKAEKLRTRTEVRDKALAQALRLHRGRLRAIEGLWYPMDQYDACLLGAISERYDTQATKNKEK